MWASINDLFVILIWDFFGRTDAESEAPVFWSCDENRWPTGEVTDTGKDWGQKEKRASEDETAGLHHQRNEQEIGQTPGDGEGQGSLACCSPWSHTESDITGQLNDYKKRLPGGARGKESVCQCRRCKRCGFDPWVKKIPWRSEWQPTILQYSCLENSIDREAWQAIVHGIAESNMTERLSTHRVNVRATEIKMMMMLTAPLLLADVLVITFLFYSS